jgi:hypothetical protein
LLYKAETLSVAQSKIWSYPVLTTGSGEITRLSRANVTSDFYILNDGINILIWMNEVHPKNHINPESIISQHGSYINNIIYNAGMHQAIKILSNTSSDQL